MATILSRNLLFRVAAPLNIPKGNGFSLSKPRANARSQVAQHPCQYSLLSARPYGATMTKSFPEIAASNCFILLIRQLHLHKKLQCQENQTDIDKITKDLENNSGINNYRQKFGNYQRLYPNSLNPSTSKPKPHKPSIIKVPSHINRPFYANTGDSTPPSVWTKSTTNHDMGTQDLIPIITDLQDLTSLRNICRLSSQILKFAGKNLIYPGITTQEIDSIVHTSIVDDLKAYPSPLNYSGFPNSICTSINNIICHGIPDSRPLADSDIINIDVTLFKDGFHGDTSCTFLVNPDAVDALGKELVEATKEALDIGIRVCGPGVPFREIGNAISEFALINGFSVSEDLTGHGIGRHFHQPPLVFHHENDEPEVMKPGMVFTIEPILCQGESEAFLWPDGWTISTADGGRSAQFEHTVLVTEDGVEVLTE